MTAVEKVHYWMLKYEMANGTPPKPKEISAQLEMAIEDEKQALSIADVSQQRELLLAFAKHIEKAGYDGSCLTYEQELDEFLKANNCGQRAAAKRCWRFGK